MVKAANLGFPRIGAKRELKRALESYWKGDVDEAALDRVAAEQRQKNWAAQRDAGLDVIPSNDFSLYDQVLDTTAMLGAVPDRFAGLSGKAAYFAMARGTQAAAAMEMTKWFDTNYHYIVPEISADMNLSLASTAPLDAYLEAKGQGVDTRPVLLGPVTWLALGKSRSEGLAPLDLLDRVLPVYAELLGKLAKAGAEWVQIDEPILARDLTVAEADALRRAYATLAQAGPKLILATYFGGLGDNLDLATSLPVAGLHVDLVRAPQQLDDVLARAGDKVVSLGLIDGRNIWRADLDKALGLATRAVEALGPDRVQIAPSCSLLHVPVDLDLEPDLDDEFRSWLAFACQKLGEVTALARAAEQGRGASAAAFDASAAAVASRKASRRIHDPKVKAREAATTADHARRQSPFADRRAAQQAALKLPALPTTTIGSFPQTQDVRKARALHRKGALTDDAYQAFLKDRTRDCVARQEKLGLDVLVHGEFERNDMVEYFGEKLDGFAFTRNGWVQSYGSRCVKPPVIFGDVSRPDPMTVDWARFAQSLTDRPMKGMLTGPVTILQWSFVRDDQPRRDTCRQIALAIRDEVDDLETAGIRIIQIDEPALREGLPLRQGDWQSYLDWAVEAFGVASAPVRDETQIHTHMCYAEFNDIMPAIAAMDADVISIETSRSHMDLLDAFRAFDYPNDIGPGVWDIHSPRVPDTDSMTELLRLAAASIPAERLWVNPDCGLKTRGWPEVEASLTHLVRAARTLRAELVTQLRAEPVG
ncbi:5-methyltetrahydropteroyltriglutamate--homocysteine S-methyltransferase [Qingshengfaniella alkalisoli]|uniref:5-methyltetrahydropteroyltriglutamate--homocysteine methyltransferase n=1 Tax=Qingshengfaniella alkalisoli TaxID=2599296 RepID=A0A5B8IYC2_9RHOB|nr:5-methyltetrahydropteroyltriglutamate--homocysteine S-methyltransferase [Qingshengfaniella alkalisoli]QDY70734.1 5-methyltetrahydropteroyltriglutamate--homocysteine S-methyltransferase [Qingshengfaniella alkalisoli]